MLGSRRAKALRLLLSTRPEFALCRDVEAACHATASTATEYYELIRKSAYNLKENPKVGEEVVYVHDSLLVEGTLVGRVEHERNMKQERFRQMLQEKYDSLNDQQFEAIIRCRKCNSSEIRWEEKQTRSADESATVYCICTHCKNRWVMK